MPELYDWDEMENFHKHLEYTQQKFFEYLQIQDHHFHKTFDSTQIIYKYNHKQIAIKKVPNKHENTMMVSGRNSL